MFTLLRYTIGYGFYYGCSLLTQVILLLMILSTHLNTTVSSIMRRSYFWLFSTALFCSLSILLFFFLCSSLFFSVPLSPLSPVFSLSSFRVSISSLFLSALCVLCAVCSVKGYVWVCYACELVWMGVHECTSFFVCQLSERRIRGFNRLTISWLLLFQLTWSLVIHCILCLSYCSFLSIFVPGIGGKSSYACFVPLFRLSAT